MKKLIWRSLSVLTVGGVVLASGRALAASHCPSGKEALELMKGLAGEWQGTMPEKSDAPPLTVTYRVTSAGSAVMETLFPGSDHEMVTMYYLDGDKLVLTHYCAMANQPHMALQKSSTPQELVFDFTGGSNVNPRKDSHMHSARIHLINADTLAAEWTPYKEGKPSDVTKFQLTRKK